MYQIYLSLSILDSLSCIFSCEWQFSKLWNSYMVSSGFCLWATQIKLACDLITEVGRCTKEQERKEGGDLRLGKIPHALEQLSPRATSTEPVLQSPGAATAKARVPWSLCSTIKEATAMRSPCVATESSPCLLTLETSLHGNKDTAQPKIN